MARLGEILAVAALLLFSANMLLVGPAGRQLPQDLGFLLALASNVGFAALLAVGVHALGSRPFEPEWDAVALFAGGGLLTSYVGRWFLFRSVRTIGPTRASTLNITNPAFTALAAWLLLGEMLPPAALAGASAVLVGLYLTTRSTGGERHGPTGARRSVPIPEIALAVMGAASYGLGNVIRGAGVRDWEAPVVGSLVGAAAGLVLYSCWGTDLRKLGAALRGADPVGRRLWLLSGILTISAQTCLIAASIYIPIAVAVVVAAAVPVVVLPVGLLLRRNESVGPAVVSGVLLVVGGVAALVLS
ncbi:DMT family transporter [Pseudonocardia sichuanensis]